MSEETSFQEYGDETDLSLNVSASSDGSTNTESNISLSYSEYLEDESGLKKESEDLFKSESEIDTTTSGSYSEDKEADSSTSRLLKETIEDVFKVEDDERDTSEIESKPFNNTDQTGSKSQHYAAEVDDTSTATSEIQTGDDSLTDKQDEVEEKPFNKAKYRAIGNAKSPTPPAELIADGNKPSIETLVEDVSDETIEQDATGSKPKASSQAEQNAMNVTYVMKQLSISDSPQSEKKSTPRQSRFRARTVNIFDSPYNTRLKARMIREREMRSRSEGGPTDE